MRLILVFFLIACSNTAYSDHDLKKNSVKDFVESWSGQKRIEFKENQIDLNGDHKKEALVYLRDKNYCGADGCNLLILTPFRNSWKIVSTITLVKQPIWLLSTKNHGWHDISVNVVGIGNSGKTEVALYFNGISYPENPTLLLARNGFDAESDHLIFSE